MSWTAVGILLGIFACVAGDYLNGRKATQTLDRILKELESQNKPKG